MTTEKELTTQVLTLLALTGWRLRYHTYRSKRSPFGFPDEVWVRDRVIFAELKSDDGDLKPAQQHWLRGLLAAGAEAYLVRPDDLQDLARILTARKRPDDTELERRTRQAVNGR